MKADPPFPVTSPPVSMVCMHAISSLLERDKTQRIGAASFESFTDNPFFREIDFEALERKEIEPIFRPSSEKTNFDATYDLEELLLEEAPLEARSRKQKPRAELRADATDQERRADELHRMVETMFEPFNYTTAPEQRSVSGPAKAGPNTNISHSPAVTGSTEPEAHPIEAPTPRRVTPHTSLQAQQGETSRIQHTSSKSQSIPTSRSQTPHSASRTRSSTHSPNGSPPLPSAAISDGYATSPTGQGYFPPVPGSSTEPPMPPVPAAPQVQKVRAIRYDDTVSTGAPTSNPKPQPGSVRQHRPRGSTRSMSAGGGVQVVLNETGSWSEMANQASGLVAPAEEHRKGTMLGFLSRKKGRDRSPKAKERERGVLGKEGARVVVGS